MTIYELTQKLAAQYRAGRKYGFVRHAHMALAHLPHAPQLALLTLRALAEMGLGKAARELLAIRPDLADPTCNAADLKSAADQLPDGGVPWENCQATYDHNVATLLAIRPELRGLIDTLPDVTRDRQLHRTINDKYFLSRSGGEGKLRQWLEPLSLDLCEENAPIPDHGVLGPAVIVGVRDSDILHRVMANTRNVYLSNSHPVFLLEQDPAHFAAWLHTRNHSALLNENRLYICVGPNAVGDIARHLEAHPDLNVPTHFVNLSGNTELAAEIEALLEKICKQRNDEYDRLAAALAERYRGRDSAWWARRLANPGVAVGVTSRSTTVLQYSTRDALDALRRLGWRTELIIEENDHQQISPIHICRRILDAEPDLIVWLDHLRYENPFLPPTIPMLSWVQDPLPNLLCRKAGESLGPLDFVCGYYKDRCTQDFGYPPERFFPTVLPVSERIFHDAPLDPETCERYACDVSFVSNASMTPAEYLRSALSAYPRTLHPLLEELAALAHTIGDDHHRIQPAHRAIAIVRERAEARGLTLDTEHIDHIAINVVYRLYDWNRRHQALEWVADWARRTNRTLRLYGRGWENHPTLAEFAAGVIEHGEPLRCANRASKLALQLVSSGIRHQRSFELLASGTLPLVRYCPTNFDFLPVDEYVRRRDAGEQFHPDTLIFPRLERVVFDTAEQFETLAESYLADESRRREVLADLRAVVLRDQTYTAVLRDVTEQIHHQLTLATNVRPSTLCGTASASH